MKKMAFIFIPFIIINIIIAGISILNIRQQNLESVNQSVQIYQDETSAKIKSIQHFIQWSVVNEPLLKTIEEAKNIGETIPVLKAFRTRVSDSQISTGTEFQYFLYLSQQDLFFNASELHLSYDNYLLIKNYILTLVGSGTSAENNSTWQSITLNHNTYFFYLITYENRTFVTFINIADLISPLSDLNLGKNGSLILTDMDQDQIYSTKSSTDITDYPQNSLFGNLLTYSSYSYDLPFNIQLYVDNFSNYGKLMLLQLIIVLVTLALCFILSIFMFYMYQKVIKPIHQFSVSLEKINEQEDILNLQSNHIQELEQTSLQFKNLIREIKKLKINIYENELAQKRFQITFLQNQIRPHFYLNCLTTISSMAHLGRTEEIESMVLFTSRYLRYLFQTDKETVQIKYELVHIQAYLDIQALRYGPIFQYECRIEEDDKSALIPPLLLITFIENIMKHSIPQKNLLQIKLVVRNVMQDNHAYLQIDITDTGQGFSAEVLKKLSNGESLTTDMKSHVGITNNIQRLTLLYGVNFSIKFYNDVNSGAHVQLYIPQQI